ncbi:hypothetical protein GCM10020229_76700 [Kitasatospora albolonga]
MLLQADASTVAEWVRRTEELVPPGTELVHHQVDRVLRELLADGSTPGGLSAGGGGYRSWVSTHIVWDWNGTLLHDMAAVVASSNAAFATLGMAPITLEQYRELYTFPIPKFLRAAARPRAQPGRVDGAGRRLPGPLPGAQRRLRLTEGRGRAAGRLAGGRAQPVAAVDARAPPAGAAGAGPRDRGALRPGGRPGRRVVRDGQARLPEAAPGAARPGPGAHRGDRGRGGRRGGRPLDGARAVLYTGGSHTREKLAGLGAPVVDSLAEAVELVLADEV